MAIILSQLNHILRTLFLCLAIRSQSYLLVNFEIDEDQILDVGVAATAKLKTESRFDFLGFSVATTSLTVWLKARSRQRRFEGPFKIVLFR